MASVEFVRHLCLTRFSCKSLRIFHSYLIHIFCEYQMTRAHEAHADGCDTGCAGSQRCRHAASCGDGGRSGCARLTSGGCAAKSLGITRHLPEGRSGGSTQRWRAAGAGLVCGTAAHRREALSARSRESCRCARPTLSQLNLGKQAGTRAQSTFETDGRPPETHLWRPLASRMSHEEGGHTPRRHTHIYGHKTTSASPSRTTSANHFAPRAIAS